MEDFIDEDTGKLGYTKKQEIFNNGYQNIIVSAPSLRPNYRIFLGLFFYFLFAFLSSDLFTIPLQVPHTFSMKLFLNNPLLVTHITVIYNLIA
jgi:hypothetical protein